MQGDSGTKCVSDQAKYEDILDNDFGVFMEDFKEKKG